MDHPDQDNEQLFLQHHHRYEVLTFKSEIGKMDKLAQFIAYSKIKEKIRFWMLTILNRNHLPLASPMIESGPPKESHDTQIMRDVDKEELNLN